MLPAQQCCILNLAEANDAKAFCGISLVAELTEIFGKRVFSVMLKFC
jgi:hypothetical protein